MTTVITLFTQHQTPSGFTLGPGVYIFRELKLGPQSKETLKPQ